MRFSAYTHTRGTYALTAFICIGLIRHIGAQGEEYPPASEHIRNAARAFVESAITYIKDTDIFQACTGLNNDTRWKKENTKLILFDHHGIIRLLQGENYRLWSSRFLRELKTFNDVGLLNELKDKHEGQWLELFSWQEDLISGYFKNVVKNGTTYTLGALIFSENAVSQVEEKVLKAKKSIEQHGLDSTLLEINNPNGAFMTGALSVAVYDRDGLCLADSFDQTHVGQRSIGWRDDTGKSIIEEFRAVTRTNRYGWITNTFSGETQHTFVLKTTKDARDYYLVSSYYPAVNDDFVTVMARNARDTLIREGPEKAFALFNTRKAPFYKSRLSTVVYNDRGVIMAHSRYPYLKGVDSWDYVDQGGYRITQELIRRTLKDGTAWVYSYIRNAMQPVYAEKVTLPEGTFVISIHGYTPTSLEWLCARRAEFLCRQIPQDSFETVIQTLNFQPIDTDTHRLYDVQTWFHGDAFFEIYNRDDFCIAAGPYREKLWEPLNPDIAQRVKQLRAEGHESAWFDYDRNSMRYRAYLRLCPHDSLLVAGYSTAAKKT